MRRIVFLTLCIAFLAGPVANASSHEEKKEGWWDRIKVKGDLRLRYEKFDWDGKFDDGNRDRFRFRLRVGADAKIRDDLSVGFELRSGNPDNPHSDNQSLDGGFNKKEISIAQAFVKFQPRDNIVITGGKFSPKKLWIVSDGQWDDDVVVEGAMEEFNWGFDGAVKKLEANAYQFVLEESGSGGDSYLIGAQIAPTFELGDADTLTVGLGYDSISHPEGVVGLTASGRLDTEPENIVTNLVDPATGEPVSDFRVANAFAVWHNKSSKKWPVKVSLFYYQNSGTENAVGAVYDFDNNAVIATANADDNDTAFYGRIQVGDYKKPGQWAFRYTRYDSEPDAMFYAFVQSDTRRGSNVDGDRLDIRVGMPAKSYINFTWYKTDWKLGTDTTMDRWQLDYIFNF